MHNRNKTGMWWVQPPESMGGYIPTYIHASTCTTSEVMGHLVDELSKLRLRAHIWWTLKNP